MRIASPTEGPATRAHRWRALSSLSATVALVLAVTGLAACGDTGTGNQSASTPDASEVSASSAPTTRALLSKAELITQTDDICTGVNDTLRPDLPADPTDLNATIRYLERYVEVNRAAVARAEALGPPATDADAWREVMASYHTILDATQANLTDYAKQAVANDRAGFEASDVGKAMQRATDLSRAFGFKVCGIPLSAQGSGSGSGPVTTPPATGVTPAELAAKFGCRNLVPDPVPTKGADASATCTYGGATYRIATYPPGTFPQMIGHEDLCAVANPAQLVASTEILGAQGDLAAQWEVVPTGAPDTQALVEIAKATGGGITAVMC